MKKLKKFALALIIAMSLTFAANATDVSGCLVKETIYGEVAASYVSVQLFTYNAYYNTYTPASTVGMTGAGGCYNFYNMTPGYYVLCVAGCYYHNVYIGDEDGVFPVFSMQ